MEEKRAVIEVPRETPKELINRAREAAVELNKIVSSAQLAINIKGRRYLRFEAWQTMGRFFGITSGTEWTREIIKDDNVIGYEARAYVRMGSLDISNAEAECTNKEDNWKDKPLWQIRSMAQTRACAKALRNVLAWTVVLAGYQPTPVEEMGDEWEKLRKGSGVSPKV